MTENPNDRPTDDDDAEDEWAANAREADNWLDAEARKAEMSTDEELRIRHSEDRIRDALEALHLAIALRTGVLGAGFDAWSEHSEESDAFLRDHGCDEQEIGEIRRRIAYHRTRATQAAASEQ